MPTYGQAGCALSNARQFLNKLGMFEAPLKTGDKMCKLMR